MGAEDEEESAREAREIGGKPSDRASEWPQETGFEEGIINFVKHGI